jgi:hypothetical protein
VRATSAGEAGLVQVLIRVSAVGECVSWHFEDAVGDFNAALLEVTDASVGLVDLALIISAVAAELFVILQLRGHKPESACLTVKMTGFE